MSTTQRVSSPTFGPAATTRVANAGRNVASVSFQRVDDLGGSNALGAQEQSIRYDDGYRPPGQGQRRDRDGRRAAEFSRYAQVSHLDEVLTAYDWSPDATLLPVEVMRGVGRYETNMRVISGIEKVGGETYNRLF
ncbi:hypothetical protein [Oleispirillum naphthae]|uniref:hypothetical protein n=1 Tax=Oleispirillum naphthae TaxID=2838853 RepID=UPI0030823041